jgi:RNA polymerase sigma-70 factor (sigma-E family)
MRSADDSAFTDFVAGSGRRLLGLAYLLTWDQRAAEDLLQVGLERAYRSWPRLNREGTPDAYVRGVMVGAATDRWHRRPAGPATYLEEMEPGEAGDAHDAEVRAAVIRALAGLPADQRAVLVLCHFEGLTESQAAAVMGRSVGTVRGQHARAIARLQALLPTGRA